MIDNEFEISKLIGMGGSSKVFLAQNSFGQKVAIKAIRKDKNYTKAAAAAMLEREHEMLQKLEDHPNVIKSLGINFDGVVVLKNESESIMYNVLEYAPHGALSNFVRYTGGIEEEIARLYVLQF
jgi:serine/threonine protein kinase